MTVRELAKAYVPKKTKNITDLDLFSLDIPIEEATALDNEGKEFSYYYVTILDDEYRVPNSVLKDIKVILEAKPETSKVQVKKEGEGLKTRYTVIPL